MQVIPELPLSVLMALPFLATLAMLNFVIFQPLLRFLEERHEATTEARAKAKHLIEADDARMAALNARLGAAREQISQRRAEARGRAQKAEAVIIARARAEADAQLTEAVGAIGRSRVEASATMKTTAHAISSDIAAQVLGRPMQA